MVEQHAHSCGLERMRGVLEHEACLLPSNPGKPFQKVRELRTVLKVLEERRHRHARAAEYPRATDPLGVSLDGGA